MSISSLRFGNATESFLSENMPKESKTATSEESLRLHVPELTRLSAELVREFVKDFESYRRRSGTARVRDGVSSATLKVLARMGITTEPKVGDADAELADDKEFIAALLGRFAPPDVDEAYALLEKIAMPAKIKDCLGYGNLEAAMWTYLIEWEEALEFLKTLLESLKDEERRKVRKRMLKIFIRGIKNKKLMEAVKDDEPADLEEASAKLESEVKKLVDVQRAIRRMTGDAYHVQMVARDADGTTIVTSGTSKRIPREHLERFREEAKSHGSIEEMLEAYEKEKEQESAKVAPPAASSGDVPMVPPTSDGGVVDKPTDRPKSNVECFRCLERGHRARACPYTEEEVRTKRGAAGTRQSGRG